MASTPTLLGVFFRLFIEFINVIFCYLGFWSEGGNGVAFKTIHRILFQNNDNIIYFLIQFEANGSSKIWI